MRRASRHLQIFYVEYLFRHALVQEAAYGLLLKNSRRGLHQSVGETLERLYPERSEVTPRQLSLPLSVR